MYELGTPITIQSPNSKESGSLTPTTTPKTTKHRKKENIQEETLLKTTSEWIYTVKKDLEKTVQVQKKHKKTGYLLWKESQSERSASKLQTKTSAELYDTWKRLPEQEKLVCNKSP